MFFYEIRTTKFRSRVAFSNESNTGWGRTYNATEEIVLEIATRILILSRRIDKSHTKVTFSNEPDARRVFLPTCSLLDPGLYNFLSLTQFCFPPLYQRFYLVRLFAGPEPLNCHYELFYIVLSPCWWILASGTTLKKGFDDHTGVTLLWQFRKRKYWSPTVGCGSLSLTLASDWCSCLSKRESPSVVTAGFHLNSLTWFFWPA